MEAALATREHHVAVKVAKIKIFYKHLRTGTVKLVKSQCATITPDEARVEEFKLKQMWR